MEFGPEIKCDGVRPEWLRDDDTAMYHQRSGWLPHATEPMNYIWGAFDAIRLPASHPYYLAADQGMIYWAGGEEPADWDGGEVLTRGGWFARPGDGAQWGHAGGLNVEIIGYRKQPKRIDGAKLYISGKPLNFDFSDLTWTEIGEIGDAEELPDCDIYDEDECDYDCDCADHQEARAEMAAKVYTVTHRVGDLERTITGPDLAHILACLDARHD